MARSLFPRLFFLGLFLFSVAVAPLPSNVADAAGLVPCGRAQDDPATNTIDERAPCTLCHLVLGGKGLIDWGLKVMIYIGLTVIVAMAILYVVSAGNDSMMSKAKGGITAALVGFAIMLCAWLIVNVTIRVIVAKTDSGPLSGLVATGAFNFSCNPISTANFTPSGGFNAASGGTGASTSGGSTGGAPSSGTGKCQPAQSGPCSIANLSTTCFGANAAQASAICNAESNGNPLLPSGVDKCQPGGEVVSWGLFQINLSGNDVGGLGCPAPSGAFDKLFSGGSKTCTVRNPLYGTCVDKAKEADANIQRACILSSNGTHWGKWGANSKCGFPN